MPSISVIMGVYNDEKYVAEAIESILNQSFGDFEFIICDDGSTDGTSEILLNYSSIDSRISLIRNELNSGLAYSLNRCLVKSHGEYIARMDSDDVSMPERFRRQLDFLNLNSSYAFVGSSVYKFDKNGIWGRANVILHPTLKEVYLRKSFIHPTVMVRKNSYDIVGGYTDEEYTKRTEDYDLWCKFYSVGMVGANIDEILLKYREDFDSFKKRKFKFRIHSYKLMCLWQRKLDLPLYFRIYAINQIIKGIIPSFLMRIYHRYKIRLK